MLLTADILQRAANCTRGTALTWAQPLSDACALYAINTPTRLAAFLAQVGHESAGLTVTIENLHYRAEGLLKTWPKRFTPELAKELAQRPAEIAEHVYGGRMGNSHPGDGYRFRGRGLLQVTGRANYEVVNEMLGKVPNAPDLLALPEALAEPKWAAYSAAAFWDYCGLNRNADAGDFRGITRRINGGELGMADRIKRYERARQVLA
jgi:Predicted chitinase